jgi:hypothetical protein
MKRSNQLSKGGAGGGVGSRALSPKTNVYFGGHQASQVNPGGADQLGQQTSNHSTDSGEKLPNPATPLYGGSMPGVGATKLGNETALNVGGGGPGIGRTLYGQSGTNQQYGPAAGKPAPQGRPILEDFGPNVPGRK